MLRRLAPVLLTVALGAIPLGCNRVGPGPASPQPIRDEKEPGESFDYVSAVPDTGSSTTEDLTTSSTETELEIDEGSSSGDESKSDEKSAGKSDEQAGDGEDEGGEDETGDEPDDIEIDVDAQR